MSLIYTSLCSIITKHMISAETMSHEMTTRLMNISQAPLTEPLGQVGFPLIPLFHSRESIAFLNVCSQMESVRDGMFRVNFV